jgi:hypothetical protein
MKWEVNYKGAADDGAHEISVVKSNNEVGKRSWGWFGPDKVLISQSGPDTPITFVVWRAHLKFAKEHAKHLNGK